MGWFRNLKIGHKLAVGFGVMLLFIGAVGVSGYLSMKRNNATMVETATIRLPALNHVLEVDRDLHQLLVAERSMLFTATDSNLFKQLVEEYETGLQKSLQRWELYKGLASTDEERALIAQFENLREAWQKLSLQIVDSRKADTREGRRLAMDLTLGAAKQTFDQMRAKLDELIHLNNTLADTASQKSAAIYHSTLVGLVIIAVAGMFFGIIMAGFIDRAITKPLNAAVAGLKDIAQGEGDLTRRLEASSRDEVGELSTWFNMFVASIQEMVQKVLGNADRLGQSAQILTTISEEMTQGADVMAGNANAVAAAAEEMSTNINSVAASMEQTATNIESVSLAASEMNNTITEIAKHSETARSITNGAVQQTKNASEKVDQLGKAARAISKVTEVITEISEQTNLLALNATIEAARAGEAGKGFAVVANEIKELARQTAAATQEIKIKINGVQGSTEETVRQISEISAVINDINEIVATISSATEEQSASTREIAGNVSQAASGVHEANINIAQSSSVATDIAQDVAGISQGVVNISGRSSKINTSAIELRQTADQLNGLMARFRV